MPWALRATIAASLLSIGCKTLSSAHETGHPSSLAKPRWKRAPWSEGADRSPSARPEGRDTRDNVRERMMAKAEALLHEQEERPGFGAEDLEQIFENLQMGVRWRADERLGALVSLARRRNAYETDDRPTPGDIVLFHNQRDVDANGQNDDWFTGSGIVVDTRGDTFDAVTRTEHAPRRVTTCPGKPSHRLSRGVVINSFVRVPAKSDPADTTYLSGQLYAGHIDIEKLAVASPSR